MSFLPWWHSHPVMWQNLYLYLYLPRRSPGHCRTLSCVWEGDVLGTTLASLDENSARDASACLCCRCFPFTQPNLTILLSTQLQASSRPINQPREGVSYCATASSLGRDTGGLVLHTHQQSFTVTQAEDRSLAGTSLLPRPASPFVVHGWRLLFLCAIEKAKVWRPGLG